MELNPIIVNTESLSSDELLVGVSAEQSAPNLDFIRREGRQRRVRFVKRSAGPLPFEDADIDPASVVSMAIGDPDSAPTSGTWGMTYGGSSTGLTGLAYNISAQNLSNALNTNPNIISIGDVTVQAAGSGAYIVTFNVAGARSLLAEGSNALVPNSTINVRRIQTGDADTAEIQLITLRQNYLAFSNDFAPIADGTIGITHIQTGSGSQPDIWRVTIDGEASGGTWLAKSTDINASLPYNATAADVQSKVGSFYSVTQNSPGSWDLIALTNEVGPTVTVNGDGLTWAKIWEGTFNLSTVNLALAFAASGGAQITSKFEIQAVVSGGQPAKLYQAPCTIRADVIDANNLVTLDGYETLEDAYPILVDERLRAGLAESIDGRIAGKNPATAKALYTTQTHTGTPAYVRNPDCWAADVDTTAISVWNSQASGGVEKGGIAISPRHILLAYHFDASPNTPMPTDGSITFRWVTADNVIVERTLTGKQRVGSTDALIGLLNADLPASITPAKVIPDNFVHIINTMLLPVLFTDKQENALVGTISTTATTVSATVALVGTITGNEYREDFFEAAVSGDSGNPACFVAGSELVLLGHMFGVTTVISLPANTDINTAMATLGGGYTVTQFDMMRLASPRGLGLLGPIKSSIPAGGTSANNSFSGDTTGYALFSILQNGTGDALEITPGQGPGRSLVVRGGQTTGVSLQVYAGTEGDNDAMRIDGYGTWLLKTYQEGTQVASIDTAGNFRHGASGPFWASGSGSPEGVVTAPVGSLYSRTNGGAGTSLYVKESGSGNTGWVGK